MSNKLKLIIQWDYIYFQIVVPLIQNVGYLKNLIFEQTGLQTHLQDFLNLSPEDSEKIHQDNLKLMKLDLANGSTLMVADIFDKALTVQDHFASKSVNDIPCGDEILYLSQFVPKKGRNLIVLDIDLTIFDCTDEGRCSGCLAARPYLKYFLLRVSELYDVVIWSATDMSAVESKLKWLGIANNKLYKIKFCLDITDMTVVELPFYEEMKVKALPTIWNKYGEYNYKSTICCDDQPDNFYFNQRNGLKVLPYSYKNFVNDQELLLLTRYLERVANFKDFTLLDLNNWRKE